MLTKLSCKNYRSIGMDPANLDLIASQRIKMHPDHVRAPTKTVRVLRSAAIYGANAAGKSNVIRALDFMKAAVLSGALPQGTNHEYCRAGDGHAEEESVFEVQFEVDGHAYDYGFSCVLRQYRITSEWLFELMPSAAVLVFERFADGLVNLGHEVSGEAAEQDLFRFKVYEEDFRAQATSRQALVFLSFVGQGKRFSDGSRLDSLGRAFVWFRDKLQIMGAGQPFPTSDFYSDGKTLDEVSEVLGSFDTGVSKLRKEAISLDDLDKHVDFGTAMAIRQLLANSSSPETEGNLTLTVRSGDAFVGVERREGSDPTATILRIRHQGSFSDFGFGDESDGTKRLFDFMDILFSRQRDAVFVIDEIDRSLHPMLTRHLVALFNETHQNDDCQLVFTTHENDIMSYDYFRKDEIWFVDRDEAGLSRLYSLDDFAEARTDSRLSKQYLEGRYGGVPALSLGKALAALSRGDD